MRRLVILRPEPAATATAERARSIGLETIVMPLFTVERLDWTVPDPAGFDALVLTSANALRHGGPGLARLREFSVYAVGEATAAAARNAGFVVAATGDGGVDRLLAAIPPDLRLLHLCGEHRMATDSPRSLTSIAVYRSSELPPSEHLGKIEGQVVAVHSPRAGQRLTELVDRSPIDRRTIRIAAISHAAASAAGPGWGRCESAPTPDEAALLALAARLCDNRPTP